MTKMKKIQVDDAMKYYREIGKLAFKSSINHHSVIKNSGNNESKLLKMMAEDRAKISRLENVIDIKQREIDELNRKEMDLYWEMGKLQKNNGALEQYKETNEKEVGDWEKKLMGHIKKGKDN
tara:strand:- start:403 stop:768 length:366 start_codon:yes stop_codon:yes gene_type:complete